MKELGLTYTAKERRKIAHEKLFKMNIERAIREGTLLPKPKPETAYESFGKTSGLTAR